MTRLAQKMKLLVSLVSIFFNLNPTTRVTIDCNEKYLQVWKVSSWEPSSSCGELYFQKQIYTDQNFKVISVILHITNLN